MLLRELSQARERWEDAVRNLTALIDGVRKFETEGREGNAK